MTNDEIIQWNIRQYQRDSLLHPAANIENDEDNPSDESSNSQATLSQSSTNNHNTDRCIGTILEVSSEKNPNDDIVNVVFTGNPLDESAVAVVKKEKKFTKEQREALLKELADFKPSKEWVTVGSSVIWHPVWQQNILASHLCPFYIGTLKTDNTATQATANIANLHPNKAKIFITLDNLSQILSYNTPAESIGLFYASKSHLQLSRQSKYQLAWQRYAISPMSFKVKLNNDPILNASGLHSAPSSSSSPSSSTTLETTAAINAEASGTSEIVGNLLTLNDLQLAYLRSSIVIIKIRDQKLTVQQAIASTATPSNFSSQQRELLDMGYSPLQAREHRLNYLPTSVMELKAVIGKLKSIHAKNTPNDYFKVTGNPLKKAGVFSAEAIEAQILEKAFEIVSKFTVNQGQAILDPDSDLDMVIRIPHITVTHREAYRMGHSVDVLENLSELKVKGLLKKLTLEQISSCPYLSEKHFEALEKGRSFETIKDLTATQVDGLLLGFSRADMLNNKDFDEHYNTAVRNGHDPRNIAALNDMQVRALNSGADYQDIVGIKEKIEWYQIHGYEAHLRQYNAKNKPFSEFVGLNEHAVNGLVGVRLTREQVTQDQTGKPYVFTSRHVQALRSIIGCIETIRGLTAKQVDLFLNGGSKDLKLTREELLTYTDDGNQHFLNESDILFYRKHQDKYTLNAILNFSKEKRAAVDSGLTEDQINKASDKLDMLLDIVKTGLTVSQVFDGVLAKNFTRTHYHLYTRRSSKPGIKSKLELFTQICHLNTAQALVCHYHNLSFEDVSALDTLANADTKNYSASEKMLADVEIQQMDNIAAALQNHHLEFLRKAKQKLEIETLYKFSHEELAKIDDRCDISKLFNLKRNFGLSLPGLELMKAGLDLGLNFDQATHPSLKPDHLDFLKKRKETDTKILHEFDNIILCENIEEMIALADRTVTLDEILRIRKTQYLRLLPSYIALKQLDSALKFEDILTPKTQDNLFMSEGHVNSFKIEICLKNKLSIDKFNKLTRLQQNGLEHKFNLAQVQTPWFSPQHIESSYILGVEAVIGTNGLQLQGLMQGFSREDVFSSWFSRRHVELKMEGIAFENLRDKTLETLKKEFADYIMGNPAYATGSTLVMYAAHSNSNSTQLKESANSTITVISNKK